MTVLPITIAITMHIRCASCLSRIHINAMVDRARCPNCGAIEQIPPNRWREFLDAATNDGPSLSHHEAEIRYDDDKAWIIAKSEQPKCMACGVRFPKQSAQNARVNGKCFCVGCGAKMGVRAVPPELVDALPCITHLLGEDEAQLNAPDAPQAPIAAQPDKVVKISCPSCDGAIQLDGNVQGTRCLSCNKLVILPAHVLARMLGAEAPSRTFYLVHDPTLPRPATRADVDWQSLHALTCDAYGNLYGLGDSTEGDNENMAFALDNQLRTKWVHKSLKLDSEAQLAWRNDGVLLLWSKDRYSAVLLRAGDGQEIGKLGGEQPPGAQHHMLDLSRAEGLCVDVDGTILFSKRDRLVRCTPDGGPTTTWPPGHGLLASFSVDKMRPFTDHDEEGAPNMREVGDRPVKFDDHEIRLGWDGRTYHVRSEHLVCFDRAGKKLFHVEVPREMGGSIRAFGADARGIVYVLCYVESDTSSIHRIVNGALSPFIDGRNRATPIRDESELAVHPDGTIVLADSYRQMRVFAPNGQPLYVSPKSLEEDKDHYRDIEKKLSEDRVR